MFRRVVTALVLLAVAALLLVVAWPQLFGLQRQAGIAQLASLRGLAAGVAGILVVALLLVALMSRRARRFAGSVALLLLVFAGVELAVLATRGFGTGSFQTKAAGDITVLSWNTLGDSPGAGEIAKLAIAQRADIVVLPETSYPVAQQVAASMASAGMPMQTFHLSYDQISKSRTTDVLVGTRLGTYRDVSGAHTTDTLPSLVLQPADGTGPTIVGAHPVSPVPGEMANWRQGLQWLADHCTGNVIAAGDFNSTLDHYAGLGTTGELGACHDGAKATGTAAIGSWPTRLPALVAAPIDHVMATSGWSFVGFRVIESEDGAGSDHRPVVAQLRPSAG